MIEKPLEQITFADVERLVLERWPESKTVDYKRDTYGTEGDDKRELLKDVSSFANTLGGDIIIGVDEDKGVPIGIPGVVIDDMDKERLRLEGIIRQGLEPRIEFGVHPIAMNSGTFVIIIRIKESLLFPHRVVFQGKFGEFWARNSGGKFSMDTDELRRAFTLSDSIYQQIRDFRIDRVNQIERGETPIPLLSGGRLVLHLIPVSSFRSRQIFDVASMPDLTIHFPPLDAGGGWGQRLNLDGHVNYAGKQESFEQRSYTQFFRNGIVEAVLTEIVRTHEDEGKLLSADYYEHRLLKKSQFQRLLLGLRQVGVQPPVWCFLSIMGVKGATIPTGNRRDLEFRTIDRDILFLPERVIDDVNEDPIEILRPMFDLIWNASGFGGSRNFDVHGGWAGG